MVVPSRNRVTLSSPHGVGHTDHGHIRSAVGHGAKVETHQTGFGSSTDHEAAKGRTIGNRSIVVRGKNARVGRGPAAPTTRGAGGVRRSSRYSHSRVQQVQAAD